MRYTSVERKWVIILNPMAGRKVSVRSSESDSEDSVCHPDEKQRSYCSG